MKFTIVAVGRLKEKFWVAACAEYLKRLQPYAKTAVVEVADVDPAKAGGESASVEKEGAALLKVIGERSHVILLDIGGEQRTSEDLSARIDDLGLSGKGDLIFVVGGSCGVSGDVRARADETLSFGPITLPHNLARVVLLEQLYRACKISRGEPYHK